MSFEGLGKIQIEKKLDQINYFIKKNENNLEFDVNLDLNKTLLKIDTLNYEKQSKSKASIKLIGSYNKYNELNAQNFFLHPPEGTIALFPSSLCHSTRFTGGDFSGERLAIVGDVTTILKDDQFGYSVGYISDKYWKKY